MVGIVLVSHSASMAQGLKALLAEIGSSTVPVAVAAGTPEGGMGTSAELVRAALGTADHGDGIVVIPDLGSAVLTVKTVLADGDGRGALLIDAPFVEGAVAAAVTAASGGTVSEVADAARQARDVPKL
jgi:phosphoenolpyruvate---glycerone phosphotransferase subunit DhaM